MKFGNTVSCPEHVTSPELVGRKFLEVFPETVKDITLLKEVPITKRTYDPTDGDNPRQGQSPRLILMSEAKRIGLVE